AEEDLPGRAARFGRELQARLGGWVERYAVVDACRGRGLAWGIELASARAAAELSTEARGRGVLLLAGGPQGRVAQLVPPLVISERQLAAALAVLENVLDGISRT
ncbi:MAG: aminotransferase class III-fold pyridoxal phosphate-dependent enzyme, partial [bacterium]|nr:aminotransferase class III-fold pyridoxal phosphate-dependent enzyme [bacterium]